MRTSTVLILICLAISLLAWSLDTTIVQEYMIYNSQNLVKGRVWTLFSSLFIHSDIFHLVGNVVFLFVFGRTLEEELNGKKMGGGFFLGGMLTFILATPFYPPDTAMVGASAAIFTLAAIAMLVKPLKFSILFLSPVGLVAIIYFLYNALAIYYGVQSTISYIGHVIGFIIGIPLGIAWSKNWKRNLLITLILLGIYYIIFQLIIRFILR